MNKLMIMCAAATVLGLFPAQNIDAATQVYDLQADWSDTQNPNGTWSYRQGDSLLINNPLPWVGAGYGGYQGFNFAPEVPAMEKVAGTVHAYGDSYGEYYYNAAGYIEDGDVLVFPGVGGNILWTAPVNGTIDISGATWPINSLFWCSTDPISFPFWNLTQNGSSLSGGDVALHVCDSAAAGNPRGFPYDFSLGSGGTAALQNIPVAAGDQIVLAFNSQLPAGLNLTITLTPDTVDPLAAIEDLAATVVEMNLQNGIENSLDSKLDAVFDALDDVNANNDAAACNALQAFINAVEAQRGNKITSAQADELIAAAQQIQALLNCGN